MKQPKLIPTIFLVMGILAYCCTRWVFAAYLDDLGLIIPASLPEILLWVLVAAAFVLAVVCVRKSAVSGENSILPAIGDLVYAMGTITLVIVPAKGPDTMVLLFRVFSYASIACLIASAVLRLMKKPVYFLMNLPVCLMAMLFLVECYQLWSEVPQLLEYGLGVGAVLNLVLFSYFRMARSANLPAKPRHMAYGLLGIFFCLGAIAIGDYPWFLAAASVWMAADLIDQISVPQEA